ncbi:MAG TPA: hypothetical protein ENL19_00505 [candidate division WOR-3 bacterium]|uniref:Uncharacterized protein n=1 Tax=candidate division WOR-3 bacterium TaxID=2052148 RepID=A0A7C5DAI1_UNCW3|nr:hypothetical protein [candidate division WOR-3 bacterium]
MKFLQGLLIVLVVIIGVLLIFRVIGLAVDSHYQNLLKPQAEKAKINFESLLNKTYSSWTYCDTPLEENAYKYYKPYFKSIVKNKRRTVARPLPGKVNKLLTSYFRGGKLNFDEAENALARMQIWLQKLRKAGCCTTYSIANETTYNGVLTDLVYNYLWVIRGIEFILYTSSYELISGKKDAGVKDLLLSLKITRDISTPGLFLINNLIAMALNRMTYTHIMAVASSEALNLQQVNLLLEATRKLGFEKGFLLNGVKMEKNLLYYEGAKRSCAWIAWGDEDKLSSLCYLKFWKDYFSYKRAIWKAARIAEKARKAFENNIEMPYQEGVIKMETEVDQVLSSNPITRDMAPNVAKIYQTYKTDQLLKKLALISLNLRKAFLEKGEYPDTLGEMEKSIGTDPMTGKPFLYKKLSKGEAEILLPMYLPENSDDIILHLCNCPYEKSLEEKLKFYNKIIELRNRETRK